MSDDNRREALERLFAAYVEHDVVHGEHLSPAELCRAQPELEGPLAEWIETYRKIDDTLSTGMALSPSPAFSPAGEGKLPEIEGFKTIEKIGGGGMGEVYKLRDLRLDRTVAAKILRADSPVARRYGDFLREARSMALLEDERVVGIHEFRPDADPPVILMEHVDGFDLGRVAPSLEYAQRARILLEVCGAVHRAHELGVQHRDLKPANILLDPQLRPKIVDFGLSEADPARGHFVGTPAYLAPEQLDPARPIDARSDVYALGVVLYEMLCGEPPYRGRSVDEVTSAVLAGRPRLPVEIAPSVPEPLQAIALKAMEQDPDRRYLSAREMALDLERFLQDRPVLARPSLYASVLGRRLLPHVEQIEEWLRLKLIYAHEAERLRGAYRRLENREDDWIVESRVLSYSQIALYLGAFLLVGGSLLYFGAHRFHEAVQGLGGPLLFLGLPFVGLNVAAHFLHRREYKAVAVAFRLGGVLLLPLFLLILFHETGLWAATVGDETQFFEDGTLSNRQLQVAIFLAWVWACRLALRTRTVGLGSASVFLLGVFTLAVLADLGLSDWLEEGRWDLLALHLLPLIVVEGLAAWWMERRRHPSFSRPLYVSAALLWALGLELLALDGRLFHYLGLSMARFQAGEVSDPVLLDTLTAMAVNGCIIYASGALMERHGTAAMRWASWALVVVSPFAMLAPIGYLVQTGEYARGYDWLYLLLSLAIAVLSHHRQRKSFYLAGVLNTGFALWYVTDHHEWFDRPLWAVTVIVVGLLALGVGFALDVRMRARR